VLSRVGLEGGKSLSSFQLYKRPKVVTQIGLYDCTKTIPIGAGQRACP
jgi:hypothetical protein